MTPEVRTRLTIDLPKELVKQTDALVARGVARSRNRLIAQAVEHYVKQIEEAQIEREFEPADREALPIPPAFPNAIPVTC